MWRLRVIAFLSLSLLACQATTLTPAEYASSVIELEGERDRTVAAEFQYLTDNMDFLRTTDVFDRADDLVDRMKVLTDRLNRIEPPTNETRLIHDRFVDAYGIESDAYRTFAEEVHDGLTDLEVINDVIESFAAAARIYEEAHRLLSIVITSSNPDGNKEPTPSVTTPDFEATIEARGEDQVMEDFFWNAVVAAGGSRSGTFTSGLADLRAALDADLKSQVAEFGTFGLVNPLQDWPQCYALGSAIRSIILLEESTSALEATPYLILAMGALDDLDEQPLEERESARCAEDRELLTGS